MPALPRSFPQGRHRPPPHFIPSEALLADLRHVASQLGTHRLSQTDYSNLGRYSFITICRRFMSWRLALEQTGLQPMQYRNIDAQSLLDDIRKVAGQLKTTRLIQKQYLRHGRYSRKSIQRLFGCWLHAVTAAGFIAVRHYQPRPGRGKRTINVSLRFQVLRRDQFRCRACGRSPATHKGVTLQVDHIIPWSRGGSSQPSNLQTLCNLCNRGKADSV
jgi:hypothetical protein